MVGSLNDAIRPCAAEVRARCSLRASTSWRDDARDPPRPHEDAARTCSNPSHCNTHTIMYMYTSACSAHVLVAEVELTGGSYWARRCWRTCRRGSRSRAGFPWTSTLLEEACFGRTECVRVSIHRRHCRSPISANDTKLEVPKSSIENDGLSTH